MLDGTTPNVTRFNPENGYCNPVRPESPAGAIGWVARPMTVVSNAQDGAGDGHHWFALTMHIVDN